MLTENNMQDTTHSIKKLVEDSNFRGKATELSLINKKILDCKQGITTLSVHADN